MLFSCKISSAVITFFERQGEDLTPLLESTTVPEEFLRDPSYWLKAEDMESFLESALRLSHEEGALFQKVGHSGPQLRSWGVLDSVIRMMPKPQEILAQPQRFLSYFISPEPPAEKIQHSEDSISFDLPISSEIYPLVTSYLKAAFESLPVYVGKPLAQCLWQDIHIQINWPADQESIFGQDPGHQISPELMRSIVGQLETHQKDLERKNQELQHRNEELIITQKEIESEIAEKLNFNGNQKKLEKGVAEDLHHLEFIDEGSIQILKNNLARLSDYMVRSQQLITLLVGQDRLKPSVKEAMRRTDWEKVKMQFPVTVGESQRILEKTQSQYQEQKNV
jgi:hypothetical protein